jgi:hypothetical protein
MKLRRSTGLAAAGRILTAVIFTLAPMSIVQAQTTEPVRAGLTRAQTSPAPAADSPFAIRSGALAGAWTVDNSGRLVWTAAEPMRIEPRSATSQRSAHRVGPRSKGQRVAQRVLAGVALGVLGFFAGGLTGYVIDGAYASDSGGLAGFAIGAPIGAAVGATVGVLIVR